MARVQSSETGVSDATLPASNGRETFNRALDRATILGAGGLLARGYTRLLAGLEVERLAAEDGDQASVERVRLWELALLRYCERFGVRLGE